MANEKSKVILLVEDNEYDEILATRALEKHHVALDYLFCTGVHSSRDPATDPALVLLDLKLPKVSGLEVLNRIREDKRTRFLPVVILTSSREEQDLIGGYSLGANSYIRKPVDFRQFSEAVLQVGLYWLVLNEAPPLGV
jgi:two-component system, response regulator